MTAPVAPTVAAVPPSHRCACASVGWHLSPAGPRAAVFPWVRDRAAATPAVTPFAIIKDAQ